jgi:tRNA dimethylallyltransferase
MTTDDELRSAFRKRYNLAVVLGATASGKTEIGVQIARRIDGEIISADSRQVYRRMDLGTGKDLSAYVQGGSAVPFHLVDILDPSEEFSVFAFQEHFYRLFHEITERGRIPLLVGGTGLYLDAVIRGYTLPAVPSNPSLRKILADEDMESLRRRFLSCGLQVHNTTDLLDRSRLIRAIEIQAFKDGNGDSGVGRIALAPMIIGIHRERDELQSRITARLEARIKAGMIDEVQRLHDSGIAWQRIDSFGLEYRYCAEHLQGKIDREAMVAILNVRIRQYAKRQMTWFRRMERNGVVIHWVDGANTGAAIERITELLG